MSKTEIENFCKALKANKVKLSQELFKEFPTSIQSFFLENAWNILSANVKGEKIGDENSYITAFRLFKLFRTKEMKELQVYKSYLTKSSLERYYAAAKKHADLEKESNSKSSSVSKSASSSKSVKSVKSSSSRASSKGKYEKEYQRYATPPEGDPLIIFYLSLYSEKPSSRLAITWLTERGVDVKDREKLIKKYKALAEKGELLR